MEQSSPNRLPGRYLRPIALTFFIVVGLFLSRPVQAEPEPPTTNGDSARLRMLHLEDASFPNMTTFVSVRKGGEHLPDLTIADFAVQEEVGGLFAPDTVTPIDKLDKQIVLVLDHSVSDRQEWLNIRQAAIRFVQILQGKDRIALLTYGNTVEILSDWSTPEEVIKILQEQEGVYEYSVLNDAMLAGAEMAAKLPATEGNNRAIVVIADRPHVSPISTTTVEDIAQLVQQKDVPIYFYCYGIKKSEHTALEALVHRTGGFSKMLPYSTDVDRELHELWETLDAGYALLYKSKMPADDPTEPAKLHDVYFSLADPMATTQTSLSNSAPGKFQAQGGDAPVTIYGIAEDAVIAGEVEVSLDANTKLPIRGITYSLNRQVVVPPITDVHHILRLNIDQLVADLEIESAQMYTLTASIVDITGQQRQGYVHFRWYPPLAASARLATNTVTTSNTITVTITALNTPADEIKLTQAELWLGPQLVKVEQGDAPYTLSYPAKALALGGYEAGVRLTDNARRVQFVPLGSLYVVPQPAAPIEAPISPVTPWWQEKFFYVPVWVWLLVTLALLMWLIAWLLGWLAKQLEQNATFDGAISVTNLGNAITDYGLWAKPNTGLLQVGFPVAHAVTAAQLQNGNGHPPTAPATTTAPQTSGIAFERVVRYTGTWTRIMQRFGSVLRLLGLGGVARWLRLPASMIQRSKASGQQQLRIVKQIQSVLSSIGIKLPKKSKLPKRTQAAVAGNSVNTQASVRQQAETKVYLTEGHASSVTPGHSWQIPITIQSERLLWRSRPYEIAIYSQPLPKNGTPPTPDTITVAIGGFRKPHFVKKP